MRIIKKRQTERIAAAAAAASSSSKKLYRRFHKHMGTLRTHPALIILRISWPHLMELLLQLHNFGVGRLRRTRTLVALLLLLLLLLIPY
jgi:hypothetical protein